MVAQRQFGAGHLARKIRFRCRYLAGIELDPEAAREGALHFDDPVVDRARALTLQHQRISPSLFQRRLKVGFVKAKKIIQILEEEGYVGPQEEGESRKVLQGSAIDDLA